ncbi:hypothetical protein LCGC14_0642130 [marine sediment metagenome]|uniref:Uncharacterized protein n=1 Tax=marine sediment metagenome TaxID=412755 RepID=A0A0F9TKC5_9ZZZZ
MNLPEEFREIEKQANRGKRKNCNVIFGSKTIREILTALSDARDALHKKDCEIGDLLKEKKRLREENTRLIDCNPFCVEGCDDCETKKADEAELERLRGEG